MRKVAALAVASLLHLSADPGTIESMIRARWAGTGQADVAVRVARCESTLRPDARHRNRNGTVDWGVFQLNDGGTLQALGLTRQEALDPEANIDAAYRLWRRYGWRRWACFTRGRST